MRLEGNVFHVSSAQSGRPVYPVTGSLSGLSVSIKKILWLIRNTLDLLDLSVCGRYTAIFSIHLISDSPFKPSGTSLWLV